MTEPPVSTTIEGGTIYGVAGAGTVIIENFYANRAPEPATARPEAKGPLPPCPYPGLSYFGPQDRAMFFGRDQAIAGLMDAVPRHGLTALVGASGSGKSSVVLAGLAPNLADSGGWAFSYFRVGTETDKNPFMALARALTPLFSDDVSPVNRLTEVNNLAKRFESGDITLPNVLGECRQRHRGKRILLIADQFEEVFTLVGDESVRQHFIDLLLAGFVVERGVTPDVCLLITLRADFYNMALRHRSLSDALQGHVENLGPMTRDELREAIEKPAGDVLFEGGLVDTLLDDVASRPGNLPLLQFALREMWLRQENSCITHQAYQDIGRVEGALAQRAHEIFGKITNGGSDEATVMLFRRLFTRLVTLGEGAQDTRRVVSRRELGDEAWGLAQRLAGEDNRLVVTGAATAGNETAEVVHEALIRNWPDLVGWVDRDRAFQTWLRQLRPRVEEWRASPADEGTLMRGGTLAIAAEWLETRGGELAAEEKEFIQASLEARNAEKRLKEERAKAARRRQLAIAVASCTAAVVLAVLAGAALWQRNEAAKAAADAEAANTTIGVVQQLARHTSDPGTRPQRSLLLSLKTASLDRTAQSGSPLAAIDAIRQQLHVIGGIPLVGHSKATRVAAFSRSGQRLATGSDDGIVRLWDIAGLEPESAVLLEGGSKIGALVFSPDGRWLFGGDKAGTIRSWKLTADGATAVGESDLGYGAIQAMAVDPLGRWLAFGTNPGDDNPGMVCILPLTREGFAESPCWQYEKPLFHLRFSSRGRWLAAGGGHDSAPVALWDLSAASLPEAPRQYIYAGDRPNGEPWLKAIAFSGDEKRLAVAYSYNAQVWDLTKENPPDHVVGRGQHSQWISSIDLSPDGRWLATASSDSRVKLWDTEGSPEPILLDGHSASVNSVMFSDDGKWLASSSSDTTARIWDLSGARTVPSKLLRGQDLPLAGAIFGPGAAPLYLVTVGDDQQARLWTISNPGADPVVLKGHQGWVAAALSSDGDWIASVGADNQLLVRSVKDPRQPVKKLLLKNSGRVVAFSPDGRWLAADLLTDPTVYLWRLPELTPAFELSRAASEGDVSMGFSLDSRWLISGGWETGAVNIWNVSGASASTEPNFRCVQDPVRGLAFTEDGRYALTGANGWQARLWDLKAVDPCANPRLVGSHNDAIPRVAISEDGRWAATVSFDNTGKLWDLATEGEPKQAAEVKFGYRGTGAAFSNDGRWAAFTGWDGGVAVVDLKATGELKPVAVVGHAGRTNSVVFTPDSKFLITSGEDRTAKIWNPADLREAPVVLRGHGGTVFIVGVSPDGDRLITSDDDGTIMLWHIQLRGLVATACRVAGRQLTSEEIRDLLGGDTLELPCTDQPKLAE